MCINNIHRVSMRNICVPIPSEKDMASLYPCFSINKSFNNLRMSLGDTITALMRVSVI